MKTSQYFSRVIKALTADKQENLQAPLFEELSDCETSKIVGGNTIAKIEFEIKRIESRIIDRPTPNF